MVTAMAAPLQTVLLSTPKPALKAAQSRLEILTVLALVLVRRGRGKKTKKAIGTTRK
jgi:hypothetical protein